MFGHNFSGFDMFFLLKGFQATAWGTKDINLDGTNLTNINFANISRQRNKIYRYPKLLSKSLGQLTATLSVNEKLAVKKLTEQFLRQHDYFSEVWKLLGPATKRKDFRYCSIR